MNPPYLKYKSTYITVCASLAVIYAVVAGPLSVVSVAADTILYSVMLYAAGIALWNIIRYGFPHNDLYSWLFLSMSAVFISAVIVGVESAMMYIFFTKLFAGFAPTIPVRLFINLLLFVIARLYCFVYVAQLPDEVAPVSEHPVEREKAIERFTVRNGNKIKVIPVEEILYISAEGDYIDIYTAEGHWLKEQTMKQTEVQLPFDSFIRVHRSYIVNVHHISRIERYGEQQQLTLRNGQKIRISANGYKMLRSRLGL